MAKVTLTSKQQDARAVYKHLQKALGLLVIMYGMHDPYTIMGPVTQAMDNLCKQYGEEIAR